MPDDTAAKGDKTKGEKPVGKVEHYYPKAKAAAVGLTDDLKVGDEIHVVGHGDDVRATVRSLQLDHTPITEGHAGQHIGVGLAKKVHEGDDVLVAQRPKAAPRKAPKKAAKARPARKPKKAARQAKKAKPAKRRAKKAARRPKQAKAARKGRAKARKAGKAKRRR